MALVMGFKMIYWTPISGSYFLKGSILEKCGKFWKNGRFSGRIWPDWGNTTRADMAGLGSIGLKQLDSWLVSCRSILYTDHFPLVNSPPPHS